MKDSENNNSLLKNIRGPADIRDFSGEKLEALALELRKKIIQTVSQTGGHLAPSLGTVELTIALHYTFNTPEDKIIWDVGHQAYSHKLLTGRYSSFHTLRQHGGISGFPKRTESNFDTFDTGHSSTSISAGLGITTAKTLKGERGRVIAVIGDGSMTAGMAYEALNQAGEAEKDLIVVLNDNAMSISPNVGAISSFLSRRMTGKRFVSFRKEIENFLKSLPGVGENILSLARKSEDSLMTFFTPGMLFEAFKFTYLGPINGHRLGQLTRAFSNTLHLQGPVLVHVLTEKGKGYKFAEDDPAHFHGVGSFEIPTGSSRKSEQPSPPSYTDVFGSTMVKLGERMEALFAITAAMPEGTGLKAFAEAFPERFLDVGIAEQHAVTFAAGLATEGYRPVVAIYSTFLQRAFDQIIHDVCLQNLPVVFAVDRGGLVGEDGPTHHGHFDISYLRNLPNMTVMSPKDENELQHMLYTALKQPGPVAVRYPRGKALGVEMDLEYKDIPLGKAEVLKDGGDLYMFALGTMVAPCLQAAETLEKEGLSAGVVNCRFARPIDTDLARLASSTARILVVEENIRQGGFGGAVLELLNDMDIRHIRVKRIGLPDRFVEHGPQNLLRRICGLDTDSILEEARNLCRLDKA